MAYGAKVILQLPLLDTEELPHSHTLEAFVERCLTDAVELIAIVGEGCERVEDIIDEIVVGDGSDDGRYLTTSSHPGESFEQVLEFARDWRPHFGEDRVVVVRLHDLTAPTPFSP